MNKSSIEVLRKKQSQIQARIQSIQARAEVQKRKDETRRKILAGSYILDKHEKANTYETLARELDKFLFRKQDRELFGLTPRDENKSVTSKSIPEQT